MPGPSIPSHCGHLPLVPAAALARDTMRVPSPPHGASAPAGAGIPPHPPRITQGRCDTVALVKLSCRKGTKADYRRGWGWVVMGTEACAWII